MGSVGNTLFKLLNSHLKALCATLKKDGCSMVWAPMRWPLRALSPVVLPRGGTCPRHCPLLNTIISFLGSASWIYMCFSMCSVSKIVR